MLPPALDTSQPLPLPMSILLGVDENVVEYTTAYVCFVFCFKMLECMDWPWGNCTLVSGQLQWETV